eukprot:gene13426-9237_t
MKLNQIRAAIQLRGMVYLPSASNSSHRSISSLVSPAKKNPSIACFPPFFVHVSKVFHFNFGRVASIFLEKAGGEIWRFVCPPKGSSVAPLPLRNSIIIIIIGSFLSLTHGHFRRSRCLFAAASSHSPV